MEKITSELRVRMSAKDAHYGGNLVDGAHMLHLFGDVATELLIRCDGDEGLFCAYDNVEFMAPVYAGDYIEARGEITSVGNTSRKMVFTAYKVITARPEVSRCAGRAAAGVPRQRHLCGTGCLQEKVARTRGPGGSNTPGSCHNKKTGRQIAA